MFRLSVEDPYGLPEELRHDALQTVLPKKTTTLSCYVSAALRFHDTTCGISWEIRRPDTWTSSAWKSTVHISTLPYGWIPEDGIDCIRQFIMCLVDTWERKSEEAERRLAERVSLTSPSCEYHPQLTQSRFKRLEQLETKGKDPRMIDNLARDAREWAQLRGSLHDHVHGVRMFMLDYCRDYHGKRIPESLETLLAVDLEAAMKKKIDKLDQTVRDLLQIVSNCPSLSSPPSSSSSHS